MLTISLLCVPRLDRVSNLVQDNKVTLPGFTVPPVEMPAELKRAPSCSLTRACVKYVMVCCEPSKAAHPLPQSGSV